MKAARIKNASALAIVSSLIMAATMVVGNMTTAVKGDDQVSAADDIAIDAEHFPDENFRNCIAEEDKNSDGILTKEELKDVRKLSIIGKNIQSLKGIEYFTELGDLRCSRNDLTELDVSNNTKLEYLACTDNQLSSLDVSHNTELMNLYCAGNQITSLDLSRNTSLVELSCNENRLLSLDLSNNTHIKHAYAHNQKINGVYYTNGSLHTMNLREMDSQLDPSRIIFSDMTEGSWNASEGTISFSTVPKKGFSYTYDTNCKSVSVILTGTIKAAEERTSVIPGWKHDNHGWWYQNTDGSRLTGQWQMLDGKWYYFDSDSYMHKGWLFTGGAWYYLSGSGAMATGWQYINGSWYYMYNNGVMATGWAKVNGSWYYMNSSGAMQTGWQKINGAWYYLTSSGAMAHSEYYGGYWLNADGSWTYPNTASWRLTDGRWWYGDKTGWYAKNQTLRIDGTAYTFDSEGYLK